MERRIARCLCIRCARTDNRCPASWPWTRTRCCSTCPMLTRTSNLDVRTSPLLQGPFFTPHCGSRADDPSSNTSRQDKVFLYGKKHIAKSAACLRMAGPGSMGGCHWRGKAAHWQLCGVEVWRGGLGGAYRLPTLSSVGASLAPPCFRFHTPLIEPDVRIWRIRLSEKTHAIAKALEQRYPRWVRSPT
jgi:hypothetical protein